MANNAYNQVDQLYNFKLKIRDLIREESQRSRAIKVAARAFIYVSGQQDKMIYSIESGQVKLMMYTQEGREYLLAIRAVGDIFGELCLSGQLTRKETAVAMQEARLLAMSYPDLLKILRGESLLEDLIQYLACCIAQQQEAIGSLLTVNSEQRLAKVLLQLGSMLGVNYSRRITILPRILYEDLAAMVGTTRSRVGFFLKHFRECGLIEVNADRSLTIETEKLEEFASKSAFAQNTKTDSQMNGWQQRTPPFSQLEAGEK